MYVTKGLAEEEETHEGQSQKGTRGTDDGSLFLSVTLSSDLLVPGIGIPFLVPCLLVHPLPNLTLFLLWNFQPLLYRPIFQSVFPWHFMHSLHRA